MAGDASRNGTGLLLALMLRSTDQFTKFVELSIGKDENSPGNGTSSTAANP